MHGCYSQYNPAWQVMHDRLNSVNSLDTAHILFNLFIVLYDWLVASTVELVEKL